MSTRMPASQALEQLRELMAILRELGNAGPRDNSFKQWRQVTLTLLQRVWAGDQARATRFRRIPFSAPSSRADAKTVRDCFVRGVVEATSYLESLAAELEADVRGPVLNLKRPPEVAAPAEFKRVEPAATRRPAAPPPPPGPIEPSPFESMGPASGEVADTSEGVVGEGPLEEMPAPHAREPEAARPEDDRNVSRPRQRLKDMLGFSDEEAAASGMPAAPASPAASRPPTASPSPAAPPPSVVSVSPPSRPPVAPGPPAPAREIPPPRPREERPAAPLGIVPEPPPPAAAPDEKFDFDFDFTDVPAAPATPAPEPAAATLREMIDRAPGSAAAASNGAAREMTEMAARLDQLGVPKSRRAMVRAALLDLADQMESPPADWAAIRQALAFVLEYPQIARRVIPMLVPYLDEAA